MARCQKVRGLSVALDRLRGQISDADYDAKVDLEQRVILQRYLLKKLTGSETGGLDEPYPDDPPRQ